MVGRGEGVMSWKGLWWLWCRGLARRVLVGCAWVGGAWFRGNLVEGAVSGAMQGCVA